MELRRALARDRGSATPPRRRVTRNLIAVGGASLFMGVSSFMILGLLPAFLVTSLGASALWVGAIEGAAESTASLVKVVSGAASDRMGMRKPLVIAGYALASVMKILFPLAHHPVEVLIARIFDRVGKGMRDAPRDALIADITTRTQRGWSFGLRFSLFSAGAMIGPVVAMVLMALTHGSFRVVFTVALIPAFLSVLMVMLIEERQCAPLQLRRRLRQPRDLLLLPAGVWWPIAFAAILTLARVGQAFLLLDALRVGVDPAFIPMVVVLTQGIYSTTSYPFGVFADMFDRRGMLGLGLALLVAADAAIAFTASIPLMALGAALWGMQMGAVQGSIGACIADAAPPRLRGLAFGTADLAIGLAALAASFAAGALWMAGGATLVFGCAGALAALAGGAILVAWRVQAPKLALSAQ